MASILALKRRITAAQNVSRTTRAMQMIAASKFKRAQNAALASRPYVERLTTLTQEVVSKIDEEDLNHPYLQTDLINKNTLLLVFAPDKGLCGGMVTNLVREFLHVRKNEQITKYITVGKKIEAQVARLQNEVIASFLFGTTLPKFDMVYPIAKLIDDYYLNNTVGSVKILSTKFSSVFQQIPNVTTLLPISLSEEENRTNDTALIEPSANVILDPLLKHYLEMTIYQNILESFLSEQASRMLAMQNATNNAKDIIEELRLEYNKTRQAKITSEILDITNTGKTTHEE